MSECSQTEYGQWESVWSSCHLCRCDWLWRFSLFFSGPPVVGATPPEKDHTQKNIFFLKVVYCKLIILLQGQLVDLICKLCHGNWTSLASTVPRRSTKYNAVSNLNSKRNRRPRCSTEQEDRYITVSNLRNKCLTGP